MLTVTWLDYHGVVPLPVLLKNTTVPLPLPVLDLFTYISKPYSLHVYIYIYIFHIWDPPFIAANNKPAAVDRIPIESIEMSIEIS